MKVKILLPYDNSILNYYYRTIEIEIENLTKEQKQMIRKIIQNQSLPKNREDELLKYLNLIGATIISYDDEI